MILSALTGEARLRGPYAKHCAVVFAPTRRSSAGSMAVLHDIVALSIIFARADISVTSQQPAHAFFCRSLCLNLAPIPDCPEGGRAANLPMYRGAA